MKEHNCSKHFTVDFAEDPDAVNVGEELVTVRGTCKVCGKELVKWYRLAEVREEEHIVRNRTTA